MDSVLPRDPSMWHEGQIIFVKSVPGMGGGTRKFRLEHILGGGVTSVVWKATQLDEDDTPSRTVALKVLKSDVGQQYVDGLYDEQYILRMLWQNLKDHGVESPSVPAVYDFSPKDADIRYISMEFVSGKPAADLIGYQSRLPIRTREVSKQADVFIPNLETLLSEIHAEPGLGEKIKHLLFELNGAGEKVGESLTMISDLIDNKPDSAALLSEKDIVTIGFLSAQVFQALEGALRRSYLDFQLKNVYFDTPTQQLKILDWNVVSPEGEVNTPADLFRLASGLFFLLTKTGIEKRGKLDEVRKLGGLIWSSQVSKAVQMVLERGLDANPDKPFSTIYDWERPEDWEMIPLSSCPSIGMALEIILYYWKTDLLKLQIITQHHLKNDLPGDANAVLQIAQKRLDMETQPADGKFSEKFSDLRKSIDQLLRAPQEKLERAKEWLDANDRERARQAIEAAYQGEPQNLTICRWKALIDTLALLKMDEFSNVWKKGNLQTGMQALVEKRWTKAQYEFGQLDKLVEGLVADAKLNQMFEETGQSYQALLAGGAEKNAGTFKRELQQLSDLVSAAQPVYKELILRNWPEYAEWQSHAREIEKKLASLRNARQAVKDAIQEDFDKVLASFRSELDKFPGDPELLKNLIDYGERCLQSSKPEQAKEILETGLRKVADSPFLIQIQDLLSLSYNWIGAKRLAGTNDFGNAVRMLSRDMDTARKFVRVLDVEISKWFDHAWEDALLPAAREIADFASRLGIDSKPDYKERVEEIEKRIAKEKNDAGLKKLGDISEHMRNVLTETNPSKEKIGNLQQIYDQVVLERDLLPADSSLRDRFDALAVSLNTALKDENEKTERVQKSHEAKLLEDEANNNANLLDREKLLSAKENFLKVGDLYRQAKDLEAADRAQVAAQRIDEVLVHLDDVIEIHNRVTKQLDAVEQYQGFVDSKMNEDMLVSAVNSLGLAHSFWPEQPATLNLIKKARILAVSFKWDEKRVDALMNQSVDPQAKIPSQPAKPSDGGALPIIPAGLEKTLEAIGQKIEGVENRLTQKIDSIVVPPKMPQPGRSNGWILPSLIALIFFAFWLIPVPRLFFLSSGATQTLTATMMPIATATSTPELLLIEPAIATQTPTATMTPTATATSTIVSTGATATATETATVTPTIPVTSVATLKIDTKKSYCTPHKQSDDQSEGISAVDLKDITSLAILSSVTNNQGYWFEISFIYKGNPFSGYVKNVCVLDPLGTPIPIDSIPTITPTITPNL